MSMNIQRYKVRRFEIFESGNYGLWLCRWLGAKSEVNQTGK